MLKGRYLRLLRGGAEPAPPSIVALTPDDELVIDSERHLRLLYNSTYEHLRSVTELPEAQVERVASYVSLRMLLDGFRKLHGVSA